MPANIHGARYLAALALATACSPQPSPSDPMDATQKVDSTLPTCTDAAQVFGIDKNENRVLLTSGSELAVTQGFQGFLFVRVGLHTASALAKSVHMSVSVALDNGVEQYLPQRPVKTQTVSGGTETVELPVFFNDSTMPDLISRKAAVDIDVETATCVMRAHVDTTLTYGGYMGADAGFWGTVAD